MMSYGNSTHKSTSQNTTPTTRTWFERLNQRVNEDILRDPVDALNDIATLIRVLNELTLILGNPSTRYILNRRLREDLATGDWNLALSEAHALYNFNESRCQHIRITVSGGKYAR